MEGRARGAAGLRQPARAHDFALAELKGKKTMSDLRTLETELLAAVTAAPDEAALEEVRVSALGRNGKITALLKTLGTMTPDERKAQGPLINGLKDRVGAALAERKEALKNAALDQRLN